MVDIKKVLLMSKKRRPAQIKRPVVIFHPDGLGLMGVGFSSWNTNPAFTEREIIIERVDED